MLKTTPDNDKTPRFSIQTLVIDDKVFCHNHVLTARFFQRGVCAFHNLPVLVTPDFSSCQTHFFMFTGH